jgi:putative N6-adenine-specific DNA methylase
VSSAPLRFVATCSRGLEPVVARELEALGHPRVESETGGVAFAGDFTAGLRACWRLRAANRVVLELAAWPAADDDALYRGAFALVEEKPGTAVLPLPGLFDPARSFAVQATSTRSAIRDTRWIALKVKDALVDAQRWRYGERADVDRRQPDLALRLRLHGDRATLSLDLAGEPLDRRGYRMSVTSAPLREQLAAAALLAAEWDGKGPVLDPMCGSGTLLAEAGAIALGLAPNRLRAHWAFERLPGFERTAFDAVRTEEIPRHDPDVRLIGFDADAAAVAATRANLGAAGLGDHAELIHGDAFELDAPASAGLLVVNPPYGERLATSAAEWRRLGDLLKRRYRGWRAVVVAGDEALGRQLGLKPKRRIPFWNGPIEGRFLLLELW